MAQTNHPQPTNSNGSEQSALYFWGLGDLHFRALPAWNKLHSQRFSMMFEDLHQIWQQEGTPAFCVSPGDLVETCALDDHQVAHTVLTQQLGQIPFYPGVGNHEYMPTGEEDSTSMGETFKQVWGKPLRYSWQANGITCIMLDYPDPATLEDPIYVYLMPETLTFLDETLAAHAHQPAIIFLHCPLRNTVLARNPDTLSDFSSAGKFFSPENSQEVRDILARHPNAGLFISGHTHSNPEAPGLVKTEQPGDHPVTFVNLSSPWYTGHPTGPRLSPDLLSIRYIQDEPHLMPSFAFRVYPDSVHIKLRDHLTRT